MSWEGRRLKTVSGNNTGYSYSYILEYDADGRLFSKTDSDNGLSTYYYYDGQRLIAESCEGWILVYFYDEAGSPMGFGYHDASIHSEDYFDLFWFEKSILGDVLAVYNENGEKKISYAYDAWGNRRVTYHGSGYETALLNPFTYRGYYYDSDFGMYRLGTRYYDPKVSRFINADTTDVLTATPTALTDKNLFAYCDNNPVMRRDDGGMFWDTLFDVVSLAFSVIDVIENPNDPWAWVGLALDVVDLIPVVSGVGELSDVARAASKGSGVLDTGTVSKIIPDSPKYVTCDGVRIQPATELTQEARTLVDSLDHTGGITRSEMRIGKQIHDGYKTGYKNVKDMTKEASVKGGRIDFLDDVNKIIYELKPNNPRSIMQGIKQLKRYNESLGGGYTLILEVY